MGPTRTASAASKLLEQSKAFRDALLRSEARRAWAAIAVIALVVTPLALLGSTRNAAAGIRYVGAGGGIILLAIQFVALWLASRCTRRGRAFPLWFSAATVVLECLVPTGVILAHIVARNMAPYAALASPPVLGYALLVSLSTLRLRPSLSLVGGAVSGGGYFAVYLWVVSRWPEAERPLPLASYHIVPLLILMSGVIAAWIARETRGYLDAALAEAETRRRAERLERDLAVAQSIQRALLPRAAPSIPGFDIAGWNRPADETGGDYFDWQPLPDGRWIITLADVSGHGIGPALVTAACRAYVRASAAQLRELPALATRVNSLLAADLPDGRFVTMASVLLDPRSGPLALLSAGHGPIVLFINSTRQVRDLLPADIPLAIDPDVSFGPSQTVDLATGDLLALVTDGFVEWARFSGAKREEFGLARLRESLTRHAALPAAKIIEAVAEDVKAFAGSEPQQDDLTMVVIKRTA